MDTTTRRAEALSLLALETLTDEQMERLDILTGAQAEYPVLALHDYCTSVDACLTLFPECDLNIRQIHGAKHWLWQVDRYGWQYEQWQGVHKRLEIALLKVYWTMQPD